MATVGWLGALERSACSALWKLEIRDQIHRPRAHISYLITASGSGDGTA
jgi:hypothetical protein